MRASVGVLMMEYVTPSHPQYSKGENSETAAVSQIPFPPRQVPRGESQPGSNAQRSLPWATQSASEVHDPTVAPESTAQYAP